MSTLHSTFDSTFDSTFHIDVYYRHSDDYPPAQIMMATLEGSCPDEQLALCLEAAEEAVEEQEDEGVYQVSLRGIPAETQISIERVAALEQTVALVSIGQDGEGEVLIHDAQVDPLMAAIDPAVMDAIAACAAEALDGGAVVRDPIWIFVAL